jgi:outer membrane protein
MPKAINLEFLCKIQVMKGVGMRNKKCILVMVCIAFLGLSDFSLAADVAKIGVVDLQRVMETSDPGKSAQAQIKQQKDKMETDLKDKGTEIEQIRQRLEREAMVMSKESREEKEREARIKLNDFKTLQKKYRNKLQQLEKRLVSQLRDDTIALVDEIGKKGGYLLIISRVGVLYSPNTIDITDQLIKRLNERYAKKSGN